MAHVEEVPVEGTIRLGQFLKLVNLAEDGVEAREMIQSGQVSLNGQVETRRGKQLAPGDVIEAYGEVYRVEALDD